MANETDLQMTMSSFSYNLSTNIKDNLKKIDDVRSLLLCYPITPVNEKKIQWEAGLDRVYWALSVLDMPMKKTDLVHLLMKDNKKVTAIEKFVKNYKQIFDYFYLNWLATNNKINSKTIRTIYRHIFNKSTGSSKKSSDRQITRFLEYLQTGDEHPVIKAGVSEIALAEIYPYTSGEEIVPNLLGYIFLYKYGYDMRRILVKEEFIKMDNLELQRLRKNATKSQNLTYWLENYTENLYTQTAKAYQTIQQLSLSPASPKALWKLNSRQKEIVMHLQESSKRISNKDVQKKFNVSQITASRDLSKLEKSGLLFSHGKGRSTYYTG